MTPQRDKGLERPVTSSTSRGGLLAAGLFCLLVASPIVANAASTGVPTVDIAATCRESEKAITSMFGLSSQQTFDRCMKLEGDAWTEIDRNWRSYTGGGRQRCVNTTVYLPSYVEWLTCLEMEQHVEALRRSNTTTTGSAATDGQGKR